MRTQTRVGWLGLLVLVCGGSGGVRAQEPGANPTGATNEPRVALTELATANDVTGRTALGGRLRTQQLDGTQDAPLRNVLLVVENRSPFFYNYASGYATFYDAAGVRCGAGLWTVDALAPGEQAEVDTPGLRLSCTPAAWRLSAVNLLTRTTDVAKPAAPATAAAATDMAATDMAAPASGPPAPSALPALTQRLEININGKTLPLQLGNALDIVVGKERVVIVVTPAP